MIVDQIYEGYMKLLLTTSLKRHDKIRIAKECVNCGGKLKNIIKKSIMGNTSMQSNILDEKLNLVIGISKEVLTGKSIEEIIPKFVLAPKYSGYKSEIFEYKKAEYNQESIDQIVRLLSLENQYITINSRVDGLKQFFEKLDSKQFDTVDYIVKEFKNQIETLYLDVIAQSSLRDTLENSSYVDFSEKDGLDGLYHKMTEFYQEKNTITTGYKLLDYMLSGGLEKTRLYVFAGKPGVGKSTFLLNLYYNTIKQMTLKQKQDSYVLYITLENLVIETTERLICMDTDNPSDFVKAMFRSKNKTSKNIILNSLEGLNGGHIAHFPSRTLGIGDLYAYIEQLNMQLGKRPMAIFVDYLDIMQMPKDYGELRHQLGAVTLGLKNLGVKYQIPVVTASQLLKGSYQKDPTMSDVKESSEKLDHSDLIGLLMADQDLFTIIVDKNRDGKLGRVTLERFPDRFKIKDIDQETVKQMNTFATPEQLKKQQSPNFTNQTMSNILSHSNVSEESNNESEDSQMNWF